MLEKQPGNPGVIFLFLNLRLEGALSLNGLGLCFKEGRSVFLGTTLLYRFLTKTEPPH